MASIGVGGPIPDQDLLGNLQGTGISIRLEMNFDMNGIEFQSSWDLITIMLEPTVS